MKVLFSVVSVTALTISAVHAAPTVTFTNVLDTAVTAQSYSATYVPVADKFLVGGATGVQVFNGLTGAAEGSLDLTGIVPGGLGFFALTADGAGEIYAFEDGGRDIWRWDSVTDTSPEKVYDNSAFQRVGSTGGSMQPNLNLAFTGSANNGPVDFFQDDGTTFTFDESVVMTAKSALTINASATKAWAVGDTNNQPIHKWTKTGDTWTEDTTTWVPTRAGAGPMAYDEVNDVLFVHPENGGLAVYALDGTTGETIGTATTINQLNGTAGYNGGYVQPLPLAGTVFLAGRLAGGSTQAALWRWTYVYTPESTVSDWVLY